MSDFHSEVILSAVMSALATIRRADGFYTTPEVVERSSRLGANPPGRPCLSVRKGREEKRARGNTWDCDLTVMIEAIIAAADDEREASTEEACAQIQDDVERALAGIDWEALRAIMTRISSANFLETDANDPEDGVEISVNINYAHDRDSTRAPLAI
jgi:alkanesulfonate monooxygenase SsuD/methylene tetrahydromethanopterin reductase-like flavin-dependent oxidoreductase (luciferase family)